MKTYPVKVEHSKVIQASTKYQADFLYLTAIGKEVFPLRDNYFPSEQRTVMEQEIFQKLGQPDCSNETLLVSVRTYLAAFQNEHARIDHNPKPIHFYGLYPVRLHYVSNDLCVLNIGRDYDQRVIGQKVTAINNCPIAEVEKKMLRTISADNSWTRKMSVDPFHYSRPAFYKIAELSTSTNQPLRLEFADHQVIELSPTFEPQFPWHDTPPTLHPITHRSKHPYDCQIFPEQQFAYLQFNVCFDKTAILDGVGTYVKPWLRPLAYSYLAFQFRKPSAAFSQIYDLGRPVFKDYLASKIEEIQQHGVTNLILDLRYNNGGELALCRQLLYFLTDRTDLVNYKSFQYNPEVFAFYNRKEGKEFRSWYLEKFGKEPAAGELLPTPHQERPIFASVSNTKSPYYVSPDRPVFRGKIVVLVNQNTKSAASILAGLMQDNGIAKIVGTTAANNPTGPTGLTLFKLPHSGILISMPAEYLERARPTNGDVLQPDYWVENSIADVRSGRDAAFEKALELLDRQ